LGYWFERGISDIGHDPALNWLLLGLIGLFPDSMRREDIGIINSKVVFRLKEGR